MSRDSHYASEHSVRGSFIDVLTFPFRLIWGFIVFMVFAWTTSRNGLAFFLAIPAMVFAVIYLALVWAAGFKGETKALGLSASRYIKAKDPEEANYNPDAALLFARKMVDLMPEAPEYKYELGLSYELTENMDRAYEIMNWLAPEVDDIYSPEAGNGFSNAHIWLARYYSTSAELEEEDLDEEQRKALSRKHVKLAYAAEKLNVEAVLGMAGISRENAQAFKEEAEKLRAENRIEEAKAKEEKAEESIKDAVKFLNEGIDLPLQTDRQLYASIALIEILQEQGDDEEARMTGLRFINLHERNAELYPDLLPFWISIVRTCILIEDFDRGMEFIIRGYQLARNPEVRETLQQLAAQIEVEKSKSFEDMDDEGEFVDRLYSLSKAVRTNVNVPLAYENIIYYVDGFDADNEKDVWLRDAVLGMGDSATESKLDPRIPGIIHIVLGLRDIVEGNPAEGKRHWEIASQQFQLTPVAVNFLIQVYARERELSVEKKLELINIAVQQFPQSAFFHATRGRFLQENGSHKEAIDDLEFALARIPENLNILETLAESLEANGDTEKLEECNQRIEALKAASESGDIFAGFYSSPQQEKESED